MALKHIPDCYWITIFVYSLNVYSQASQVMLLTPTFVFTLDV